MTAPAGIDERLVLRRANLPNQRIPIVAGHRDVGEQHVDVVALKNLNRIARVRCERDLRAAILQRAADQLARIFLIVHDEHSDAVEPRLGAGLFARRRRERLRPRAR